MKRLPSKAEYRLMNGSAYEGLSIRKIYYDDNNSIMAWTKPILEAVGTEQELRKNLVDMFKDLDDMLEAASKPTLDEAELEAKNEKGLL